MKAYSIVAALGAAALLAAQPVAAQDWRGAAEKDLAAIRDILKAEHPAAVVEAESASFRAWVDQGYEQARALTPRVIEPVGHIGALNAYVGGFRDAALKVVPYAPTPLDWAAVWPNFSTAWRDGGYVVAWSGSPKGPPVGARLIGCGGVTAEQIARTRLDRFEGDLELEADRVRTAPYLLWDRSQPIERFIPPKCDFQVGNRRRAFNIEFRFDGAEERAQAFRAAVPLPAGPAGVEAWNGGWWVRVPTLVEDSLSDLLNELEARQSQLREAPFVVLDLRGASTGSGRAAYRTAFWLWGSEMLQAYAPQAADVTHRAKPGRPAELRDHASRLRASGQEEAAVAAETLAAEIEAAVAEGRATVRRNESVPAPAGAANPMGGKVIVLTDAWCQGPCLDAMDLLTRLPGVVHAGAPTGADSRYVGAAVRELPSGRGFLVYPDRYWADRARGPGRPYTPAARYDGDAGDETAYRAWVAGLVAN